MAQAGRETPGPPHPHAATTPTNDTPTKVKEWMFEWKSRL